MSILVHAFRHAPMKRQVAEKIHRIKKKYKRLKKTETQCYNNTSHSFHQPNKHIVFILRHSQQTHSTN